MGIAKYLYTNYPKQYGFFLGIKEQIILPFKKFLFRLGFKIYFSNKEQDKWVVEHVHNFKKRGFFVDLAATDGIHENNTIFLEKYLDWNGICVEPNKLFFSKLKNNRKVKCICEVVSDKTENISFFSNGGIGGIIGDEFDNNVNKRKDLIFKLTNKKKIETRKTITLYEILEMYKAPKVIDYLSLDVEGAETAVLQNFPFEKYKFLCITIERPSAELNEILFNNQYIFVKNYKVDTFYLHESMKNKVNLTFEPFEQVGKKQW